MNKTSLINDSNQLNKFTLLEKNYPNYESKYNDLEEEECYSYGSMSSST